ncbi:MAG: bifunctional riboflavin kinase/FAD synthetase [Anaerolineales bacterium]
MQHFGSLSSLSVQNAWLTMGTFDGVHRGHQAIIRQLVAGAHAENAPAVVITFDPHPVAVLRPEKTPRTLTPPDVRAALLGALGVDIVITHPFTHEVAALSARDFLTQLKTHLGFTQFWVGYDFAMGHNREGNIPTLRRLGEQMGYTVHVVEPVAFEGKTVSSSQIRKLIAEGQMEETAELLGRPYSLSGKVIEGAKRGRTIGIPTANLSADDSLAIPARGVYACRVWVNARVVDAVTNIGLRPTFENGPARTSVEAHLLDFSEDLYGQVIQLEFHARLREEQKFSGVEALVAQIRQDIAQARALLGQPSTVSP